MSGNRRCRRAAAAAGTGLVIVAGACVGLAIGVYLGMLPFLYLLATFANLIGE